MSDNNPPQEFASILLACEKGLVHDKASELLREAVAAVKDQGKPAEINIRMKITPVKNNTAVVQIEANPTAKIPQAPRRPAIFYTDDDGGLHRNDPTQREFDYGTNTATDGKSAAAGRD
ncbi:hypothetical protein ACXYX3_17835 [Mycobacterium sp. C3-094]